MSQGLELDEGLKHKERKLRARLSEMDQDELIRMLKSIEVRKTQLKFVTTFHRNTRGDPLEFVDHYGLKQIYYDPSPILAMQSSVQDGKTDYLVTYAMACLANGLNVFHILSKYDARNAFVADRIDPLIEEIVEYRRMLRGSAGKRMSDSKTLKHFGKGTWKFVGSNVSADFKDFPGDVLIGDEVDEFDMENFPKAPDRLEASPYKFERYACNPTIEDYGINEMFKKGKQYEMCQRCPSCEKYRKLDFFECVVEPITDSEGEVIDYVMRDGVEASNSYVCHVCSTPLDADDWRWIAMNPKGPYSSYHISKLMNRKVSPITLFHQFMEVRANETKLMRFYNSILGIPYTAEGSRVSESLLKACSLLPRMPQKLTKGYATMGIDVGVMYDVRISLIKNERRYAIYIGKVKTTKELHELVKRYRVRCAVIDAMPETREAKNFQDDAKCDVWRCAFGGRDGKDIKGYTVNEEDQTVRADRTFVLDSSLEDLRLKKNILPVHSLTLMDGEYKKEMTSIVRILEVDAAGNQRFKWTKAKDHQRLADAYDWLAGELHGVQAASSDEDEDDSQVRQANSLRGRSRTLSVRRSTSIVPQYDEDDEASPGLTRVVGTMRR